MIIEEGYDTIIVGGCLAGFTSDAYLMIDAKKILLLERYAEVGGNFREFTDKGHVFNSGIKAIESGRILKGVIKTLGLELNP